MPDRAKIRITISGPPDCGKSVLAEYIRRDIGRHLPAHVSDEPHAAARLSDRRLADRVRALLEGLELVVIETRQTARKGSYD